LSHAEQGEANTYGSFPVAGPVTYLTDDPLECQRLMAGPPPPLSTWFHGTTERAARLSCVQGIAPGCWIGTGGQCCGVLGYGSLSGLLEDRSYSSIVEVVSPALAGDLKAWWVPPTQVRGVWRLGIFLPRKQVAAACREPLSEPIGGCACPLSALCCRQQELWRSTRLERGSR
jgi:hypothetical protein